MILLIILEFSIVFYTRIYFFQKGFSWNFFCIDRFIYRAIIGDKGVIHRIHSAMHKNRSKTKKFPTKKLLKRIDSSIKNLEEVEYDKQNCPQHRKTLAQETQGNMR